MSTPEELGTGLWAIIAFAGCGYSIMSYSFGEIKSKSTLAALLFASLTAWLWMPWVCLGVYSLSNINTSMAAHVRRPDQVTPVPPRTYRADETPTVEKP